MGAFDWVQIYNWSIKSPAHYAVPKEHNIQKDAQRSWIVQV